LLELPNWLQSIQKYFHWISMRRKADGSIFPAMRRVLMNDEEKLMDLMIRYQAGQAEAFDELYRLVKPKLLSFLIVKSLDAQLAEELLQETFLQIHRSRRTYLPGKPVSPWLFSIAHHVFLSDRRTRVKRKKREESIENCLRDFPVPSDIETGVDMVNLRNALAGLPPEQRESVLMHHYWGFSFREIGGALGILAVTAKLRAHRGLIKLREYLKAPEVTGKGDSANKHIDAFKL
jgi:RNA polymerase sigma-70 factor (ECF subfamily)